MIATVSPQTKKIIHADDSHQSRHYAAPSYSIRSPIRLLPPQPKLHILSTIRFDVWIVPAKTKPQSENHWQEVVEVKRPLVHEEVSILQGVSNVPQQRAISTYPTQRILNYTAGVSNGYERTRRIQDVNVLLPVDLARSSRRRLLQSLVPRPSRNDEEHEDKDLEYQAAEDDILAFLHAILAVGFDQHTRAAGLHEEA
jgi:hypothetical protein